MIDKIRIFESQVNDPYVNLAMEKYLMDGTGPTECLLYLWQNQNTVVIGQNQNAWAECRTALLEQEGGHLARRLSGGGAVFHDLGNLNFTFLVAKENYDLDRQLEVISRACLLSGIQVEKSGRNDILAEGRKFSGNAFYQNATHAYHHGTLLVDVDMDRLSRYLSPPKAKLEAKGVQSVRSRVVNLRELAPELTTEKLKQQLTTAFGQVYGLEPQPTVLTEEDQKEIQKIADHYASWDYLYGAPLRFSMECEGHYKWGHLQLQIQAKSGSIIAVKAYTDSMDWTIREQIEKALTGATFEISAIRQALDASPLAPDIRQDLLDLLGTQMAEL